MFDQPMYSAPGPEPHRMEHEVGNVGLLSLVHHVVMLVNMENVRWRDPVCPPSPPPSGKGVIVTFHNHGDRTGGTVEQSLQTVSGVASQPVDLGAGQGRLARMSGVTHPLPRCAWTF